MNASRAFFTFLKCCAAAIALAAVMSAGADSPPVILLHPQSQTVAYNCSVTFSVGAIGWPALTYQWFRDGIEISGAAGSQLTISNSLPTLQGAYHVVVSNPLGYVTSSNADLTVLQDTFAPTISDAARMPGWNAVVVDFSVMCGGLDPTSAQDHFNYSIAGLTVTSATLLCSGTAVMLTTSPQASDATYVLRVENVQDTLGNVCSLTEISLPPRIDPCVTTAMRAICITHPPTSQAIVLGGRAEFRVVVESFFTNVTFQWEILGPLASEWQLISGATQSTVRLPPAYTCAQSGTLLQCRIGFGPCEMVTSPVELHVGCDCAPLYLAGVTPLTTRNGVIVAYSDMVTPETAADIFNYDIPGLEILFAEMLDGRRVLLHTATQALGQTYTLWAHDISNLSDPSCGANLIAPNSYLPFLVRPIIPGLLRYELWRNILGTNLSDLLFDARYPNSPDESGFVNAMEIPRFTDDHYGVKLSGFIVPPRDTDYRFSMCAGGDAALSLSPDEDPSALNHVHRLDDSLSTPRDFRGGQAWSWIPLKAGTSYYVECVYSAGAGPDHAAVAWQTRADLDPGFRSVPIPGTYLAAYVPLAGSVMITQQPPPSVTSAERCRVALAVGVDVQPPGTPISFQWQRNGVSLPGANAATFVSDFLSASDSGARFRCLVSVSGQTVASAETEVIISGLPASLRLLYVFAASSNRLVATFNQPVTFNRTNFTLNAASLPSSVVVETVPAFVPQIHLSSAETFLANGEIYTLTVRNIRDWWGGVHPGPFQTTFLARFPAESLEVARVQDRSFMLFPDFSVLQEATSPYGPWRDVPDAFSGAALPWPEPAICAGWKIAPAKFYRLRIED